MCFSKNASAISFIVGVVGSLLCVSLGTVTDKIFGYLLLYVSSMQAIEYLLWSHQKCDTYNRIVSIVGMLLNNFQPLVLGFIIIVINPKIRHISLFYLSMFIYLCAVIPYSLSFLTNKKIQCTIKNKKTNHLEWNWNNMNYYKLVYLLFIISSCVMSILGFPTLLTGCLFAFFIVFSYTTTALFYSNSVGALWCYYVVFTPIVYYILRKIYINFS